MKYKILIVLLAATFLGGCAAPVLLTAVGATAGVKGMVDDSTQDDKIKELQSRTDHLEKAMKYYLISMETQCSGKFRNAYVPSIFRQCK